MTSAETPARPTSAGPFGAAWPAGRRSPSSRRATFVGNDDVSGLAYQPSGTSARGTLWAVQNGPSILYKLTCDGAKWVNATGGPAASSWSTAPTAPARPTAEGVTTADGDPNALYMALERDGGGVERARACCGSTSPAPRRCGRRSSGTSAPTCPACGANAGPEAITLRPGFDCSSQRACASPRQPLQPGRLPRPRQGPVLPRRRADGRDRRLRAAAGRRRHARS